MCTCCFSEKQVEKKVVAFASSKQIDGLKLNSISETGLMDRLFLIPGGVPLFIEFKSPKGGILSPKQKYLIEKYQKNGYDVLVCEDCHVGINEISKRLGTKGVSRRDDKALS